MVQTRWLPFLLLLSCEPVPPPSRTADDEKQLLSLVAQRDQANAQWTAATIPQRVACELKAGDCRMTVNEKREQFLRDQPNSSCRQPDPELETQCSIKALMKTGDVTLAVDYLSADLWCLGGLLKCLVQQQSQAEEDSVVQRTQLRRQDVESSAQGIAARARSSLAPAQIAYLRATLPPTAETECTAKQAEPGCREKAQQKIEAIKEEYLRGEKDYARDRAIARYEQASADEATCSGPELDCLKTVVNKYGETTETRRLLEKNLDLLKLRQALLEQVGVGLGTHCIDQGVSTHQPQIIQSYLAFVREPVLFFRMQLHRSFIAMHQSQIDCLKGLK